MLTPSTAQSIAQSHDRSLTLQQTDRAEECAKEMARVLNGQKALDKVMSCYLLLLAVPGIVTPADASCKLWCTQFETCLRQR